MVLGVQPHGGPNGTPPKPKPTKRSSATLHSRAPPRPTSGLSHRGSPHSNKLKVDAFRARPPSRLPAIRPFPIHFGMRTPVPLTCCSSISHTLWHAVPRPAYLLFVHFPYALACGPPSRLPAIRPFPIRFGMRTPVPLTCYSSISHTLWHADPCSTYLPFVHFPSRSAC